MQDASLTLPTALGALLERGLMPHASLIVGGTVDQQQTVTDAIAAALAIAPADTLAVAEAPKIEELRQIIGRIHLKPFQSELSLLVFHKFDMWKEECANLLLKTLEEPPAHARIILYATHGGSILRTILSRVARFRLPTAQSSTEVVSLPDISAPLAEQFAWSKEWAASEATTQTALSALIQSVQSPVAKASLLAYTSDIGNHPVNGRLAIDTALLIRHNYQPTTGN